MVATLLVSVFLSGACANREDKAPDPEALIATGEVLFVSEGCVNCHGEVGEGVIGPRLAERGVLKTFPSCDEQIRWVSLGSAGWARDVGATYGSTSKPVRGGMPGFGGRLTPQQVGQVVSFTRVEFGGADPGEVTLDCVE